MQQREGYYTPTYLLAAAILNTAGEQLKEAMNAITECLRFADHSQAISSYQNNSLNDVILTGVDS